MKYISTRNNYQAVDSAFAINHGMVPVGGLFVPETFPQYMPSKPTITYRELAEKILGLFLTDFTDDELKRSIKIAYSADNFESHQIAPLIQLDSDLAVLELWHGPTGAFKDLALQLLPYLLIGSASKLEISNEIVILVATSGDTGKAALEGFKDIAGTRVVVFYPKDGVSYHQEKQMLTTAGGNTYLMAVKGNFDDCQKMVKEIFSDEKFAQVLRANGKELSSANSINWGRLVPQIVYYYHAYQSMVRAGSISSGDPLNFAVPTGNFGNILAGYYAKLMGLPINKLVCASNKNKILYDFFESGVYDPDRAFFKTSSPSMDILVSSNLERFLFELYNRDGDQIAGLYRDLAQSGSFRVGEEIREKITESILSGYAEEVEVREEIRRVYSKNQYLIDTHTAVASQVVEKQREAGNLIGPTVLVSTASAFKFALSVFDALTSEGRADDEEVILTSLQQMTGVKIHRALKGLETLPEREEIIIDPQDGKAKLQEILGIG